MGTEGTLGTMGRGLPIVPFVPKVPLGRQKAPAGEGGGCGRGGRRA